MEMIRKGLWRVRYEDPIDAAAAALLELILEKGMDPWAIDLSRLATLYMEKVKERGVDFRVAGKVVRMLWLILAMKSESLLREPEEEWVPEEAPQPQEGGTRILVPHRRPTLRPVTLGEILEAIEELRKRPRRRRETGSVEVELPVHEEPWEGTIDELRKRLGEEEVPMSSLHDGTPTGFVNVFFPALVLVLWGEAEMRQEEPYGEIYLRKLRSPPPA